MFELDENVLAVIRQWVQKAENDLLIALLPVHFRPDLTPEEQERLTDYAVSTRYPGDYEAIPLAEARLSGRRRSRVCPEICQAQEDGCAGSRQRNPAREQGNAASTRVLTYAEAQSAGIHVFR